MRRSAPVPVRFTEDERKLVESAARAEQSSLSAWVRDRAVAAAKRHARARGASDPVTSSGASSSGEQ